MWYKFSSLAFLLSAFSVFPQNHINNRATDSTKHATKVIFNQSALQRLPVRGVNAVLGLQAGIVTTERKSTVHALGGRDGEVAYFVDGVRTNYLNIPQIAIARQEMHIGNVPVTSQDALSGMVNIETISGTNRAAAGFEAFSSFDGYGHQNVEGFISAPIVKNKLSFALSGRFENKLDANPSWKGYYAVRERLVDEWEKTPQVVKGFSANGQAVYVPFPREAPLGSTLKTDFGRIVINSSGSGNTATFIARDGKEYAWNIGNITTFQPQGFEPIEYFKKGELIQKEYYEYRKAARDNVQNLNFRGNVVFTPKPNMRLRMGFSRAEDSQAGGGTAAATYRQFLQNDFENKQRFATWKHQLGEHTSYQLTTTYEKENAWTYRPEFGREINNTIFYADGDHPANALANNYRRLQLVNGVWTLTNGCGTTFSTDGCSANGTILGFYNQPALASSAYRKSENTTRRYTATASTKIGAHHLAFGADYEQSTRRFWSIGDFGTLAKFYDDGSPEEAPVIQRYDQLNFDQLKWMVGNYYGYNIYGKKKTNIEYLEGLKRGEFTDIAPHRPRYYGGFLQDRIEGNDFTLDLGLRLEVFDNNTHVLKDRFSLYEIDRAGTFQRAGYAKPANIGDDWGILFENGDDKKAVSGYRDLNGNFYDAKGNKITFDELAKAIYPFYFDHSTKNIDQNDFTDNVFTTYKPIAKWLPRIHIEYRAAEATKLFASYSVTSQRPSSNYQSLYAFYRLVTTISGSLQANTALEPINATEYQFSVQHFLKNGILLSVTGILKRSTNLVGQDFQIFIFPWSQTRVSLNDEFSNYKSVLFSLETPRKSGAKLNVHYTLASATGNFTDPYISIHGTSNFSKKLFNSRLDFDQRHNFVGILDYQTEKGKVPTFLENFNATLLFVYKSGNAYSVQRYPNDAIFGFLSIRNKNNATAPSAYRFDLKVEKSFSLGNVGSVAAFIETQNLLNRANVVSVFPYSGQPDEDGYLNSSEGLRYYPKGSISRDLYDLFINNGRNNYGIPRLIRGGLRWHW